MNDTAFVETKEHRLFHEFCDACKKYRYIGLCYGPPGVGKTLSARYYAHWDLIEPYTSTKHAAPVNQQEVLPADALFYTVPVVNSPNQWDRSGVQRRFRSGGWRSLARSAKGRGRGRAHNLSSARCRVRGVTWDSSYGVAGLGTSGPARRSTSVSRM